MVVVDSFEAAVSDGIAADVSAHSSARVPLDIARLSQPGPLLGIT